MVCNWNTSERGNAIHRTAWAYRFAVWRQPAVNELGQELCADIELGVSKVDPLVDEGDLFRVTAEKTRVGRKAGDWKITRSVSIAITRSFMHRRRVSDFQGLDINLKTGITEKMYITHHVAPPETNKDCIGNSLYRAIAVPSNNLKPSFVSKEGIFPWGNFERNGASLLSLWWV